jgi:hypothetical protein
MELPNKLEYDKVYHAIYDQHGCELTVLNHDYLDHIGEAIVQRYNAHAAREQTLADVAELARQLAQDLSSYNNAYALVRQIRAILKKAREG